MTLTAFWAAWWVCVTLQLIGGGVVEIGRKEYVKGNIIQVLSIASAMAALHYLKIWATTP